MFHGVWLYWKCNTGQTTEKVLHKKILSKFSGYLVLEKSLYRLVEIRVTECINTKPRTKREVLK